MTMMRVIGDAMATDASVRQIVKAAMPRGPVNYSRTPQWIDPNSDRYHAILRDLQAGVSYYRVARNHGICVNTARRIGHRHGITRSDPKVQAAAQARRSYAHTERRRLLDLAFERVEELLADVDDTKSLQQLCGALGTLIDRRRLEDDPVTDRAEIVRDDSTRKSLLAKLAAVDVRRTDE
jgi:transposase-like protein